MSIIKKDRVADNQLESIGNSEKKNPKSESLFELATVLSQQNDFNEILRVVSSKASKMFNVEIASIIMINPRTQKTIKTVIREGKKTDKNRHGFVQNNVIGWSMKNKQSFFSVDLKKDARFKKGLFDDTTIHTVLCVPIKNENMNIVYLVLMDNIKKKKFNDSTLSLLEKLALISAPYLSNIQKIEEYFKTVLPEEALLSKYEPLGLLGKSQQFIDLLKSIEAAARCDVRVLLEGQSGTGKELIARAIHRISARNHHSFVAVDCGAIPENLIESELFGHVKGAFTGATHDRKGLFEEANGGTLFMDEIANIPLNMQAKLLRVLQEGDIRILGSNQSVKVNVRIITASSASLRKMVEKKTFRDDLYYRLHVYPIYVPTLNERLDDIPLLANYFLNKFAKQQGKKVECFHRSILDFIKQKNWEGNIRELENFIERLVTLMTPEMSVLTRKILPPEFHKEYKKLAQYEEKNSNLSPLQKSVDEFEENIIRLALKENNWNQSKAARALQISEGTIRLKMKKFGIIKLD